MTRLFAVAAILLLPVAATAQVGSPSPVVTVMPPTPPAPALHRLTPDEIAAAQAEGAERNRAGELLAMQRGDPSLALPEEKRKKAIHGEAGIGFGSNGAREVFGSATTDLGDGVTATVAGDYTQFGHQRYRPF